MSTNTASGTKTYPGFIQQMKDVSEDIGNIHSIPSFYNVLLTRVINFDMTFVIVLLSVIVIFAFLSFTYMFFKDSEELGIFFAILTGLVLGIKFLNAGQVANLATCYVMLMIASICLNLYYYETHYDVFYALKGFVLVAMIPLILYITINHAIVLNDIYSLLQWLYENVIMPIIKLFTTVFGMGGDVSTIVSKIESVFSSVSQTVSSDANTVENDAESDYDKLKSDL